MIGSGYGYELTRLLGRRLLIGALILFAVGAVFGAAVVLLL